METPVSKIQPPKTKSGKILARGLVLQGIYLGESAPRTFAGADGKPSRTVRQLSFQTRDEDDKGETIAVSIDTEPPKGLTEYEYVELPVVVSAYKDKAYVKLRTRTI